MALMIIDTCMSCDACRVVCPVDDYIVQNPDVVETKDQLMAKHQQLHG